MSNKPKKPLENQWLLYAKQIMPAGASQIQRQETRRSFCAGASAMFGLFTDMPDGISEEEGAAIISALQQECADFFSRVGKDY